MHTVFWLDNLKISHGRPRHREDNITMDLRETGWEGVGWIHLAKDEFLD
jgi:hypothetical protein